MLERRVVGATVRLLFDRDRNGGPWNVPSHLPHETVTFEGNTGAHLAGRYFHRDRAHATGDVPSRGVVVLVHPDRRYGQHWFVREAWIDFLIAAGFEVLTFDLTGYGASRGPASYYHEDVAAAARFAARWSGGLPVHVIGISIGAFATSNAAPLLQGVESLTLESPYPSFRDWYVHGPGTLAQRALGAASSRFMSLAFRRSAAAILPANNLPRAQPRRILIAASPDDQVTPEHLSRRTADLCPSDRTRYIAVPGAPHLGLLGHSADYRQTLLENLGVPPQEAAPLARPPLVANAEAKPRPAPAVHTQHVEAVAA